MSSTASVDRPSQAVTVAQQYYRRARPLTYLIAVVVVGVVGVGFFILSFWPWLLLAGVTLLVIRLPIYSTSGHHRLTTTKAVDTVRAEFTGPTPPMLAFQWGLTNNIEPTDNGGRYTIPYLGGVRSVEMVVESHPTSDQNNADYELVVTAGGSPWGTYYIDIQQADDDTQTIVDIRAQSARRFGLRRLPQWLVARAYRTRALHAQGYEIIERETNLSFL